MIHANERYSRAALERALIRVVDAAADAEVSIDALPDDFPTDLQDSEGEILTLGCLIEDLHHEVGVTGDEGEALAVQIVPDEMFVSRADAIAAWRIDKRIAENDLTVTVEEVAFAESVRARKAAWKAEQKRQRDAEPTDETPSETDVQAALRTLRAAGMKATVVSTEELKSVVPAPEEPKAETPNPVTERVRAKLAEKGLRRREESAEPVEATA